MGRMYWGKLPGAMNAKLRDMDAVLQKWSWEEAATQVPV